MEYLNREFDQEKCRIAIQCVAMNVSETSKTEYWVRNRRVLPHARKLQHFRIKVALEWAGIEPDDLFGFAYLYEQNDMYVEAEGMYRRALDGKEKAWGPEHTSTLSTVNNLGLLYADQGKLAKAEEMYRRALDGYIKARGSNHPNTKLIARNLSLFRERKSTFKKGKVHKWLRRLI